MLHALADVGYDFRELRLAVGAVALGEHAHRSVELADAVDAAGKMVFGAERRLEKAIDDFAVGKALLLGALARGDRGQFARDGDGSGVRGKRDGGERQQGDAKAGRRRGQCAHCQATLPYSEPTHKTAYPRARRFLLVVQHDHGGADRDAAVEAADVLVGHAEATRGYRLTDRLRLVGAVYAVERRAQIHRARAKRILDTALHVTRQVRPAGQHLRRRRPVRPFLLGGDPVHAAPAEAVAADADAVT